MKGINKVASIALALVMIVSLTTMSSETALAKGGWNWNQFGTTFSGVQLDDPNMDEATAKEIAEENMPAGSTSNVLYADAGNGMYYSLYYREGDFVETETVDDEYYNHYIEWGENCYIIGTYTAEGAETPTEADFAFDSATGVVAAAAGKNLGTITTYYFVDDAWTSEVPTAPGSYKVGVVTTGSDDYAPVGEATAPYTVDAWVYVVATQSQTTAATTAATPKTADSTNASLYIVISIMAVVALGSVIVVRRKDQF